MHENLCSPYIYVTCIIDTKKEYSLETKRLYKKVHVNI